MLMLITSVFILFGHHFDIVWIPRGAMSSKTECFTNAEATSNPLCEHPSLYGVLTHPSCDSYS